MKASEANSAGNACHIWCDNPDCKQLPEFFNFCLDKRLGRPTIKYGTVIAELNMNIMDCGTGYIPARIFYFCTDCIDLVFQDMRKTMDKSLWIFH